MSEPSAKARKKSKHSGGITWRKYLVFLTIFVILLYLLSLLIINTSWAKNKLITRLEAKTNSEWDVGSVLWVPFGKVELNDLNTSMGAGGIHLESLKISPSWGDLFSGSVSFEEAMVSEADIDLDLKWLKENLSKGNGDVIVVDPVPDVKPKPSIPKPRPPLTGKRPTVKPPVRPAPKPVEKTVVTEKPKINDLPNRWLKVNQLNLTLRNGKEIIEEISGVSLSIPFAGKPADGEIKYTVEGVEHEQKITWDGRRLRAEEKAGEVFSVNYQWQVLCRTSQPGMPFVFRFVVPKQKLNHRINKPNLHWNITSNSIAANVTINGSLRSVNTWRGRISASSAKTVITETQKTFKCVEFDHTRLVGTVANGVLNVPSAEAIGYKVSILANGAIQKNSYSYGVLRLITTNSSNREFSGIYHATKFINIDTKSYHLTAPLDTPDRRYCDVYIDGKLSDLEIRHDRSERWQPLNPVIKKLRDFKNNELQEDGLLEEDE